MMQMARGFAIFCDELARATRPRSRRPSPAPARPPASDRRRPPCGRSSSGAAPCSRPSDRVQSCRVASRLPSSVGRAYVRNAPQRHAGSRPTAATADIVLATGFGPARARSWRSRPSTLPDAGVDGHAPGGAGCRALRRPGRRVSSAIGVSGRRTASAAATAAIAATAATATPPPPPPPPPPRRRHRRRSRRAAGAPRPR